MLQGGNEFATATSAKSAKSVVPSFGPQGAAMLAVLALAATTHDAAAQSRPRARDLGIVAGIIPPGPRNAITDVAGVRVGHATVNEGEIMKKIAVG